MGDGWSKYWSLFPSLPASPSPASAKVSCQGEYFCKENICLMIFYDFNNKVKKSLINHLETNKNLILGDGWNKYWSLCAPLPPSLASAKVACQGAKKIWKSNCWWFSMIYIKIKEHEYIIKKPIKSCIGWWMEQISGNNKSWK